MSAELHAARFKAVFFDLDGTLVDTEALALDCNLEVFAALGHPVAPEFLHGLVGKDGPNSAATIRAAMPDLDMAAFESQLQDRFAQALESGLALKPGVRALLGAITVPKLVVTSSSKESAARKLAFAGIAGLFEDVITLADVALPKPAPEPYLVACQRLGVEPKDCLVFEDSETGAESAHRAGCFVVQVPDFLPSDGEWADVLAPNLLDGARQAGLIGAEITG